MKTTRAWQAVVYSYTLLDVPFSELPFPVYVLSLSHPFAISFGTDPYLGNEIVCCACNGENDLMFFNKLTEQVLNYCNEIMTVQHIVLKIVPW